MDYEIILLYFLKTEWTIFPISDDSWWAFYINCIFVTRECNETISQIDFTKLMEMFVRNKWEIWFFSDCSIDFHYHAVYINTNSVCWINKENIQSTFVQNLHLNGVFIQLQWMLRAWHAALSCVWSVWT